MNFVLLLYVDSHVDGRVPGLGPGGPVPGMEARSLFISFKIIY